MFPKNRILQMPLRAVMVFILSLEAVLCAKPVIMASMGDKHQCSNVGEKVLWVSEETSAIVTGRSEGASALTECTFRFGVASPKPSARLLLKFEYIYIHDCGVELQVNESATSEFKDNTNREIYLSRCNTQNPDWLFSQPKHYLQLRLSKENYNLLKYNFYLNVSMAESLPETGPALHVVIIVGFVLGVIVICALYLLMKYVVKVTDKWREERQEEAMSRAISLYNSQDQAESQEPDMMYVTPMSQNVYSNQQQQPQSEGSGSGSSHGSRRPEIAFVHSDGRIERFVTEGQQRPEPRHPAGAEASTTEIKKHLVKKKAAIRIESGNKVIGATAAASSSQPVHDSHRSVGKTDSGAKPKTRDMREFDDSYDIPPSYEEALQMPVPESLVEEHSEEESLHDDHASISSQLGATARLELDYMNVGNTQASGEGMSDSECAASLLQPQKSRIGDS